MKVILLSDVRQTGRRGEVVEVKPGFARNFLLPQRMAALATPGNLKGFEQQRTKIEAQHAEQRSAAAEVATELDGTKVEIAKRASESETLYGSVTPTEVAEALKAKGFSIDRRIIDMAGGIKTLGDHAVRVDLHADVVAEITVQVVAEA